ncbi:MAG: hypothetical protein JSS61_07530 [Verrucomicrobia bacterium]|nr:hypothetical protein [Verrucomicrobiota bacterium]
MTTNVELKSVVGAQSADMASVGGCGAELTSTPNWFNKVVDYFKKPVETDVKPAVTEAPKPAAEVPPATQTAEDVAYKALTQTKADARYESMVLKASNSFTQFLGFAAYYLAFWSLISTWLTDRKESIKIQEFKDATDALVQITAKRELMKIELASGSVRNEADKASMVTYKPEVGAKKYEFTNEQYLNKVASAYNSFKARVSDLGISADNPQFAEYAAAMQKFVAVKLHAYAKVGGEEANAKAAGYSKPEIAITVRAETTRILLSQEIYKDLVNGYVSQNLALVNQESFNNKAQVIFTLVGQDLNMSLNDVKNALRATLFQRREADLRAEMTACKTDERLNALKASLKAGYEATAKALNEKLESDMKRFEELTGRHLDGEQKNHGLVHNFYHGVEGVNEGGVAKAKEELLKAARAYKLARDGYASASALVLGEDAEFAAIKKMLDDIKQARDSGASIAGKDADTKVAEAEKVLFNAMDKYDRVHAAFKVLLDEQDALGKFQENSDAMVSGTLLEDKHEMDKNTARANDDAGLTQEARTQLTTAAKFYSSLLAAPKTAEQEEEAKLRRQVDIIENQKARARLFQKERLAVQSRKTAEAPF